MHRTRSTGSLIALGLAGLAAAALATPAHGALRKWKIAGALSGEYSIQYSIFAGSQGCLDTVSESARDVKIAVRSRGLVYDTSERSLLSIRPLSLTFDAGEATFSGTVTPSTAEGCDAQEPYSCTGQVRGESGTRAKARLNLFFQTRKDIRGLIEDSTLVVVRGGQGGPPESPCEEMAQSVGTRGEFGSQANDVLGGALRVPRSKLAGRRAFRIVGTPHRDEGCEERFKRDCVEHSTLRLVLTFRPS